jgi:hypothetical protein
MRLVSGDADREAGQLTVALSVILVLGLLGSVITARAIGAAFISSGHQHAAAAVSQADAGLADALYRIDQASTGTGTAFCVEAGDPKCVASSVPAAPGDSYLATQVSSTDWLVQSSATVNGQTAAVQGHVTESPQYPFALFGNASLNFNGLASAALSTYDPTQPSGSSNPNAHGAVSIGSNGSIVCSTSLSTAATVDYYGAGGVSSTGTSSCGSYQKYPDVYSIAVPTAPSGALPCPGIPGTVGGIGVEEMGSAYAGAPSQIASGTYLCTTPVAISGLVKTFGAVQLDIILDSSQYGSTTPALTIQPGSYVNDMADYCANGGSSGCDPTPSLPTSQNLQILTNGTGPIGNATGGYDLGGIVYAPNAALTQNGGTSRYFGSVTVGSLNVKGGAGLYFNYDTTLASDYGPWSPGLYTEIDPSTFTSAMTAAGL